MYHFVNLDVKDMKTWGLCWSSDHVPTIADAHMHGPEPMGSSEIHQLIPNLCLEADNIYKVRAYAELESAVIYSNETVEVCISDKFEPIILSWNRETPAGLPEGVELFSCNTTLNKRTFMAWYAVADIAGDDIELRVQIPDAPTTVTNQAGEDCLVLVNGAYFSSARNSGFASVAGEYSGYVGAASGSSDSSDPERSVIYNVTRGCFGVDSNSVPSVFWAGTDASDVTRFYPVPLPSYKGHDRYQKPSATVPVDCIEWDPYYAVTAGPVLVKGGRCVCDLSRSRFVGDYYVSNYEMFHAGIFSTDEHPDRTAVGILEDGRVLLFVCDGRIMKSSGATIAELALIMKGLGCVDAVNLDGGGSTAMIVMGERVNALEADMLGNQEDRAVFSTLGFFRRN